MLLEVEVLQGPTRLEGCFLVQKRREVTHPMLTKAFLHSIPDMAMPFLLFE